MAGAPHTVGGQAGVPKIVVPVTRRGLELDDRTCWSILIAAMGASAALLLYLSRGVTFGIDELIWIYESPGTGLGHVLDPYNGSLIATNRLMYRVLLETVGPDYAVFRVIWVASVLASAALLYALVKRRIGALPALAPAIVLLFFGSAGAYFTSAIGFIALFSIAAGLAALLLLERDDALGRTGCCALLIVSAATFSTGLAFLVGVAISVLLRRDRRSRAWIFLVPLALYAAWWLWARGDPEASSNLIQASNVLLIPSYVADSLAASLSALAGLNYEFDRDAGLGWGHVLAAAAVAALVVRLLKGRPPRSLWVAIGIVLVVWTAGALTAGPLRPPDSARYLYMGAVGTILIGSAAASSLRFTRFGLAALFLAAAVGLTTNLALLRERSQDVRDRYSAPARASFAMLDLARTEVDPAYTPPVEAFRRLSSDYSAGLYLRAAAQYGSLGIPLAELEREDLGVREHADATLAGAKGIELMRAGDSVVPRGCRTHHGDGGSTEVELPRGGAYLRVEGPRDATVTLGRFAPPSVDLGSVSAGAPETLRIRPDADPRRWRVSVADARAVEVCALS